MKHARQDKSESVSSVKETSLASTTVHNFLKTKRYDVYVAVTVAGRFNTSRFDTSFFS